MQDAGGKRRYRMTKRLDDVEATRRRIVEAAVELHGSVGPANTTFSAVADTAGVQRSTVYRHFPDEEALFGACTSHWLARHPWPAVDEWREEADPLARLRRGLVSLYGYYGHNRQMLANSFRDVEAMPSFVGELLRAQIEGTRDALLHSWSPGPGIEAAVRVAIDFRTWLALDDSGLDAARAADLMSSMIGALDV